MGICNAKNAIVPEKTVVSPEKTNNHCGACDRFGNKSIQCRYGDMCRFYHKDKCKFCHCGNGNPYKKRKRVTPPPPPYKDTNNSIDWASPVKWASPVDWKDTKEWYDYPESMSFTIPPGYCSSS